MRLFSTIIIYLFSTVQIDAQVTPGFIGVNYVASSAAPTCSCVYTTTLTIDHTKCGATDDSNFPVLVSFTDNRFKSVANSGHVYRSDGFDIEFYGTAGDTTSLLSWYIESYTAASGIVVAWVKIPTVSHTTDLSFYMRYGMTWVNHSNGTNGTPYSNNYIAVWFLREATGTNNSDFSGNGWTATQHASPVQTAGQINGSLAYVGLTSMYCDAAGITTMDGIGNQTITYWGKRTAANNAVGVGKNTSQYNMIEEWTDGNIYMSVFTNQYAFPTNAGDRANDNSWHHISMTFDGSQSTPATKLKYYLDGSNKALSYSGAWTTTVTSGNNQTFYIGRSESNQYTTGTIDHVTVRSVTSSADWELKEANNQIAPTTFITLGSEGGPTN